MFLIYRYILLEYKKITALVRKKTARKDTQKVTNERNRLCARESVYKRNTRANELILSYSS